MSDQVAYGQPPKRRKTRWERMRTPLMLAAHVLSIPAIIVHWLLMPVYAVPLHEIGWGPIATKDLALLAGGINGMLLLLAAVAFIAALAFRFDDELLGRWWWDSEATG